MAEAFETERSDLARMADIALYQAKRDGGQRAQFYTGDLSEIAGRRHALEVELRLALEIGHDLRGRVSALLLNGRFVMSGVEALARWNHLTLAPVPPLALVSLAEERGLIDKLGAWVLAKACETARPWDLGNVWR